MKKKNAVILSIMLGMLFGISLMSCNKNKHEAKNEWKNDETKHWHECATKGHNDKLDEASHTYDDGKITTEPTETSKGVKTFTCSICNYKKETPIDETKHTHTFDTTNWEKNETHHWHKATCTHKDEKDKYENHTFSEWEVKVEASLHVDKVLKRTCSICNYIEEKTEENTATHTYSNTWSSDETHHFKESTCEGHNPKLRIEEAEHRGEWTIKTKASYGVDQVEERTCLDCNKYQTRTILNSALEAKENNISVETINFTYSGRTNPINDLIVANNKEGMDIKYEGTNETTYEESTTGPINAGTYKYTITIPATVEWQSAKLVGNFEIKKYQVACPDIFISTLTQGQEKTNVLCEIDVSDDENINLDEIYLIYANPTANPNFKDGVGAGRMKINKNSNTIKVEPSLEANVEIANLPVTSNNKYIEWIVKDENDKFSLRITDIIDSTSFCYKGNIVHGSVEVGDKVSLIGATSSKKTRMVNASVTKIEYNEKYTTNFLNTTVATKDEIVKITIKKDDESIAMSLLNYIVAAQDIGTINQYQKTQTTTELTFNCSEYRIFKLKVDTSNEIQINITNQSSVEITIFNAKTYQEISLVDNKFNITESMEIVIIVKQNTSEGTHQITVNCL